MYNKIDIFMKNDFSDLSKVEIWKYTLDKGRYLFAMLFILEKSLTL